MATYDSPFRLSHVPSHRFNILNSVRYMTHFTLVTPRPGCVHVLRVRGVRDKVREGARVAAT